MRREGGRREVLPVVMRTRRWKTKRSTRRYARLSAWRPMPGPDEKEPRVKEKEKESESESEGEREVACARRKGEKTRKGEGKKGEWERIKRVY